MPAPRTGVGIPGAIFSPTLPTYYPFEPTVQERAEVPGTPGYQAFREGKLAHEAERGIEGAPLKGPLKAAEEGAATGITAPGKAAQSAVNAAGKAVEEAIPSGWLGGVVELLKSYGLRLFEILAGGALVLFGLVTIARGGRAPSLPSVLPVPV